MTMEPGTPGSSRPGDGASLGADPIDRSNWGIGWKKMGMTKMATPLEISVRLVRATT